MSKTEIEDRKEYGVSEIWNGYLSTTSAHSINRVPLATNTGGRIYWYSLFIVALGVAFYQSWLLIVDYLQFPVVMNIRVVKEPNLVFPAITICNQNRLMASKVKGTRFEDLPAIDKAFCACRYVGGLTGERRKKRSAAESCVEQQESGINWDMIHADRRKQYIEKFKKEFKYMREEIGNKHENEVLDRLHFRILEPLRKRVKRSHVIDVEEANTEWIDYEKVNGTDDWWGLLNATAADNLALIGSLIRATANETEYLGHQPEDFIVQCSFDGSPCSYRDFRMFQNKKYGNCYTFNHGTMGDKLRFTSRSGSSYGLKVTLFIYQDEYIGLMTQEAGVRASVHRPFTVAFPEDEGLDCRPGTSTTFGIRQHEIHLTHWPYGGQDCNDADEEPNVPVYAGAYSLLACTKACIQRKLLELCQCVDDINTLLSEARICTIMSQKDSECLNTVYTLFEDNKLQCRCDQLCNETYFSVQYSSTLWPSDQNEGYLYADIATKSVEIASALANPENTKKNIVRLNVNYMELNKEILTEKKKYEIWDLLSSLGGSMGLYVGMSIVSIAEFFAVLLQLFIYCCAKLRKKDKTTRVKSISSHSQKIKTDMKDNIVPSEDLIKLRTRTSNGVDSLAFEGDNSANHLTSFQQEITYGRRGLRANLVSSYI